MITWVNFLHLHQPPLQAPEILKKVSEESYKEIISIFNKFPEVKMTLNISGSLLELFQKNNQTEIIKAFKELVSSGRIEITSSAMYHPILPLISESEVLNQIRLNREKLEEVFGATHHPKGFFLPEMAYSQEVAKLVESAGFSWLILDEIHYPLGKPNSSSSYRIKGTSLKVVFRNRIFSKSFPPESIIKNFNELENQILITAHDGEMYGHWHKDDQGFTDKVFANPAIKTITVSEYLESLTTKAEEIEPLRVSWESDLLEIKRGLPYAIWQNPKNKIQKKLWDFKNQAYSILQENKEDPNWKWAKKHYERGISSCAWWWASGRKLDAFSPIAWNPTEIEKGALEILRSVRSLDKLDLKTHLKLEKKFADLRKIIWLQHWQQKHKKKD